jgi:integrase
MATMTQRKTKTGEMRYKFEIRLKKDGVIIHQESKTFGSKSVGKEWAKKREAELEKPNAIEQHKHKGVTLKFVIVELINATSTRFGRTRNSTLNFISSQSIANLDILSIKTQDVIKHCQKRVKDGASGSTIINDVAAIKSAFKYAKSAMGMPIHASIIDEASEYLRDNRIIHKSNRRNRRPTYDELLKLDNFFKQRESNRQQAFSMQLVMWFAIYSCRRQDEIATLRLSDIDWEHKTYLIRDMKNPNGTTGNHKTATMPDMGWIVLRKLVDMANSDVLLPVDTRTVSSSFTRACKVLGIEDLHFHDLRHEGASRLAEDSFSIPQIQQVTLHDSWSSLQIYVNINQKKEKRLDYVVSV